MIFLGIGSNFTQAGRFARQHIYVVHREVRSGFMGHRQQVKHRIGRTAHCNIQRHRIQERLAGGNAAGEHTFVSFLIILISVFNNQPGSVLKQLLAVCVGSHNRTVTRKSQSDSFVQTVHGIGGKHTRTASAGGTGMLFNLGNLRIAHAVVGRLNHRINQVEMLSVPLPGFHRTAGNEHRRDVQPHRSHKHTRSNLVAVADAHHGIRLMRIHHILHAVGYDVARGQRVQHTVMPHRNAVVNGNRIEFGSKAALLFYLFLYKLTYLVQMHMSRHKLGKRVDYRDYGLSHLFFLHAVGRPQRAGTCHTAALCAERTA